MLVEDALHVLPVRLLEVGCLKFTTYASIFHYCFNLKAICQRLHTRSVLQGPS